MTSSRIQMNDTDAVHAILAALQKALKYTNEIQAGYATELTGLSQAQLKGLCSRVPSQLSWVSRHGRWYVTTPLIRHETMLKKHAKTIP